MDWTEERIEAVRVLWLAGYPGPQIARFLKDGCTTNMVVGKVNSLNIRGLTRATPTVPIERFDVRQARGVLIVDGKERRLQDVVCEARQPKNATAIKKAKATGTPPAETAPTEGASTLPTYEKPSPPTLPVSVASEAAPAVYRDRGFREYTPSGCQWPIGDPGQEGFHYCGAARTHGSYCEPHYRAATGKKAKAA